MIAEHLSEEELQQYTSDPEACAGSVIEHLDSCEACTGMAKTYRLLFAGIRQQPKPTFDFNLTELVIAQLKQPKPTFSSNAWVVYLFATIGILTVLALCFLFHQYLAELFISYSNLLLYLFLAVTLSAFLFQCVEVCRKYHKQIVVLKIS
jgi:hypothetical protein